MKSLVGTTLGQYRIVEQIGTGGMATVFKAYQPALDRYVAVKVLPAQHALTPGFSERFTREAKAVAQLNHPNILPIYDFGQEGDLSYIVMKYVPAGTLQGRLGQPLNLREATRFVEQIAGALDHAHGRGILHRDVKPSNVLLDEGDWALLTDFGLARMIAGETRLTATGVGMGTPAYMSPEQGKGEKVDQRTDIYSLGVILYEMVTGRVPYEAETPLAVVLKHIQGDLALPHSINPAIPEAAERVILKAMAREPENRYGSAGEMAEALKRALEAPVAPAVSMALPPKPEAVTAVELVKPEAIVEEAKRPIPWLPLAIGGGVVVLLVVATASLAALLVPRLLGPRATPVPTKIALSPVVSTVEPTPLPRPSTTTPAPTATLAGAPLPVPSPTVTSVPRLSGRIVFVSERDANAEIYVMNADGSGQTNLTNNPANDHSPAWSPNGRRIAFVSNRDGNAEIYVMNADGSGVTRLMEDLAWDMHQPAWSPDSQRVFFMVWSKTDSKGPSQLCSVDMNGAVQTHLTNPEMQPGSIELSPDGQRIAFQRVIDSAGHTDIFVIGIDGTGLTRLTNRETYSYHPSWSSDGRRIAFASGSIWVVNADGTGLTPLPTGYGSAWAPSWSPDGQWIAFNRGRSHDDEDIFVIRTDGTGLTQLTTSAGSDNCPGWAP